MSADYEILAECRTYAELVTALRNRLVTHTGTSFANIETIAGLPDGSLSKLTTRKREKKTRAGNQGTARNLTKTYLDPLLITGGAMLLVVIDPTTIDAARQAAARKQIVLDRSKFDPDKNGMHNKRRYASGQLRPVKRPQNQKLYANSDWSRQMNARRHLKMTDKERQASARNAARARWARLRRELATSCA